MDSYNVPYYVKYDVKYFVKYENVIITLHQDLLVIIWSLCEVTTMQCRETVLGTYLQCSVYA